MTIKNQLICVLQTAVSNDKGGRRGYIVKIIGYVDKK